MRADPLNWDFHCMGSSADFNQARPVWVCRVTDDIMPQNFGGLNSKFGGPLIIVSFL
jgi:hypothetical protein